ncbi:outer membrane lipid asymmetry maintenance protein MlaD [Elioraea sp. Yellowstone]|jgi:phospholipid/cholesterol/gamma-HCH transport system substrate-binding protein|uniref:outer membrane lipid asymmetry maintenance protein MlaD n=1 Tax=Elioraea sp. Yellowstone TaxID=2592070 RepID=UPI001153540C|nr:outer membrane lipid asymmetry maintenance protein MlaD [Elioraea sp. Yellowstone]TQF79146.1 outer membrane lipid asymmetry maintenance protein MlaD [Elioraea sp. Yellowstone]
MSRRSIAEILAGAVVLAVAAVFLFYAVTHSGRTLTQGYALTARFDRIDGLAPGADVRVSGVKVGSVVDQRIDPETYLAVVTMRIDPGIRLPTDTSAEITSESLLGGRYVALVPGGSERMLADGGTIEATQSAISLEALLGRFIFSVTDLVSAVGKEAERQPSAPARPGN